MFFEGIDWLLNYPTCFGWECDEIHCPDKYAIKLPSGDYLKCEDFDAFQDDKKIKLLK